MTQPTRRSLAWRLYALALVQLVLLAVVFFGTGALVRGTSQEDGGGGGRGGGELHRQEPPELRHMRPTPGPPGGVAEPPEGRGPPPPRMHQPPGEGGPGVLPPMVTLFVAGVLILAVGSVVAARWIVKPLREIGRAAKALGAGDLSARTGMDRDDELGDMGRAFDEMAERVQRLVLAEKELLANVSHELRTPLARIRVALDIAAEGHADAGRLSMAEISVDLTELEAIIDDILTATRLEMTGGRAAAAELEMHREETRIDALCQTTRDRFRALHRTRPLEIDVAPDLPLVEVDPALVRRAVTNLLENAHKYSPDPTRPVLLRARRHDRGVLIEVIDQGIGIPEGDLPHVFAPFFRGEKSRARGTGGVGLGLTLTKRIVESHGGTITVSSAPGAGTTVKVELPAIPS